MISSKEEFSSVFNAASGWVASNDAGGFSILPSCLFDSVEGCPKEIAVGNVSKILKLAGSLLPKEGAEGNEVEMEKGLL